MADRELTTILNSGEVNTIFLGGTASTDKLIKKSELDASYTKLDGTNTPTKVLFYTTSNSTYLCRR